MAVGGGTLVHEISVDLVDQMTQQFSAHTNVGSCKLINYQTKNYNWSSNTKGTKVK